MVRSVAVAGLVALAACSSGQPFDTLEPLRTVLLGYPAQPTAADSAALSGFADGTVTMYPLIKAMTVQTRIPAAAFAALTPKPGRITDFDSLQAAADSLGATIDLELTVAPIFGAADSAFVVATGFHDIAVSRPIGLVDVDVTPADFPLINRLAANSTIISGHLFFVDITSFDRARGN